jgi:hypothetical protein
MMKRYRSVRSGSEIASAASATWWAMKPSMLSTSSEMIFFNPPWLVLAKKPEGMRASGITFEQATNCHPVADALYHDFWRIKDGLLPALL